MVQARSTKIISMIKWIRASELSVKNNFSLCAAGICLHLTRGLEPWTFRNHSKGDHTTTEPAVRPSHDPHA